MSSLLRPAYAAPPAPRSGRSDFNDPDAADYAARQWRRIFGNSDEPQRADFERFRPKASRSDLILDGPVGRDAPNRVMDGFRVKKLMRNAGALEFRPGIEGLGDVSDETLKRTENIPATNNLKVDGQIEPGGPTLHVLGRDALGHADGKPPPLAADEFFQRFGKRPDRNERGEPIFGMQAELRSTRATSDLTRIAERRTGDTTVPAPPTGSPPTAKNKPPLRQRDADSLRRTALETARVMGLDPDLLKGADTRTYLAIMGIFSYRHLDKRQQRLVNIELERLRRRNVPLYSKLTTFRADMLVQPEWRIWSLSDNELRRAIKRHQETASLIDPFSTTPAEGAAAVSGALARGGAALLRSGVGLTVFLALAADGMRKQARKMREELERRGRERR